MKRIVAILSIFYLSFAFGEYVQDLEKFLVQKQRFVVNGIFYMYDFNQDNKIARSDWIYLSDDDGNAYQLLGVPLAPNNAFGWLALDYFPDDLDFENFSGLFVYIKYPGDPQKFFSWLYVMLDGSVYKLMGATPNGNFVYLDIDNDGRPDPLPDIDFNISLGDDDRLYVDFFCVNDKCQQGFSVDTLFPKDLNESKLAKELPGATIKVDADVNESSAEAVEKSVETYGNEAKKIDDTKYELFVPIGNENIGKPLFVDGEFVGIIDSITPQNGSTIVTTRHARSIEEVYQSISFKLRTTDIARALQRGINQHLFVGTYDYMNKEPLRISLKKGSPLRNGSDDVILRIDFPKGYTIPLNVHKMECDFATKRCSIPDTRDFNYHLDVPIQYAYPDEDSPKIEISTEGSYIELGLGNSMEFEYNKWIIPFRLHFDDTMSAYFKSNIKFQIKGNAQNLFESGLKFEKELEILKPFKVEIPLPPTPPILKAIKVYVEFKPMFTFGAEGKLEGKVEYRHSFYRQGNVHILYNYKGPKDFSANISDGGKKANQNNLNIEVTAEAKAYIFPNITSIPSIKPRFVNWPLTFVSVQSGIALENTLSGKIGHNFLLEPFTDSTGKTYWEAELKTALLGKMRGKWLVYLGEKELYKSDDYTDLASTKELVLLDWKIQLLHKPQIKVTQQNSSYLVTFASSDDAKIQKHIKYCYRKASIDTPLADIKKEDIPNCSTIWKQGDAPITLQKNEQIKVRAFLLNKDVSQSIWKWGTSISEQASYAAIELQPPRFDPPSTAFKDDIVITLTQPQGFNDNIYVKEPYSDKFEKYTNPIRLTESGTISALTAMKINGKLYKSPVVSQAYTKCADDEEVVNGKCVPASSSSSSSSSASSIGNFWPGWPEPEYCEKRANDNNWVHRVTIDKKLNRFALCWYRNKNLYAEEIYMGEDAHGIWKRYRSTTGRLVMQVPYVYGKPNGLEIHYYDNGQKMIVIPWNNGEKDGKALYYDENGCMYHWIIYQNDQQIGEGYNQSCYKSNEESNNE